jgi:hypothetical protein
MQAQVQYLKQEMEDTLNKRFAYTGLDIEMPIMDNEGGDWELAGKNKLSPEY